MRRYRFCGLVVFWLAAALNTHAAEIPEVFAGTGVSGFGGDGGQAAAAMLKVPSDIHVTPAGEVFLVDAANNRIRTITVDGTIKTVVGNGQRVYTGDGIGAAQTGLTGASGLVVDGRGAIYYAEWGGHRVRRVDPSGTVTTIAGNGESGYVGEGLQATETSLWTPSRIFLDGKGNLYIAEWGANRIRKVDPTGRLTTVAGNGEAKYSGDGGPATDASLDRPNGLFVTRSGDLYISDLGNNRIRKVGSDGIIRTIAGNGEPNYAGDGGPATEASLKAPSALFVDDGGTLFICDSRNNRIRKVDPVGTISTALTAYRTYDPDGKLTRTKLRSPGSVFVDVNGDLYLADGSAHRVIRLRGAGAPSRLPVSEPGTVGYARHTGILQWIRDLF